MHPYRPEPIVQYHRPFWDAFWRRLGVQFLGLVRGRLHHGRGCTGRIVLSMRGGPWLPWFLMVTCPTCGRSRSFNTMPDFDDVVDCLKLAGKRSEEAKRQLEAQIAVVNQMRIELLNQKLDDFESAPPVRTTDEAFRLAMEEQRAERPADIVEAVRRAQEGVPHRRG